MKNHSGNFLIFVGLIVLAIQLWIAMTDKSWPYIAGLILVGLGLLLNAQAWIRKRRKRQRSEVSS